MKKHLFILITSLIIYQALPAQVVFCPPGTEWHYNFVSYFPYRTDNTSITYTGDTIAAPDTFKILLAGRFYKEQNCKWLSRTLIRQKGDTIFMNNNRTQNSWQILYNFAALPNHSWTTTLLDAKNNVVTFTITVDSVGMTYLNNFLLKTLFVTYAGTRGNGVYTEATTITERIGSQPYLFNYHTINCVSDADILQDFLCYHDQAFGTKQFTDKPCNYSDAMGLNHYASAGPGLEIYPNPVSVQLVIASKDIHISSGYTVDLVDLLGEKIITGTVLSGKDPINVEHLKPGIYFIRISDGENLIGSRKIIKE